MESDCMGAPCSFPKEKKRLAGRYRPARGVKREARRNFAAPPLAFGKNVFHMVSHFHEFFLSCNR